VIFEGQISYTIKLEKESAKPPKNTTTTTTNIRPTK
jgi:hypothetical protein